MRDSFDPLPGGKGVSPCASVCRCLRAYFSHFPITRGLLILGSPPRQKRARGRGAEREEYSVGKWEKWEKINRSLKKNTTSIPTLSHPLSPVQDRLDLLTPNGDHAGQILADLRPPGEP